MFEKNYPSGHKVVIENGVIAVYAPDGHQITNSNVDYYYEERGYACESDEQAADVFYSNFVLDGLTNIAADTATPRSC